MVDIPTERAISRVAPSVTRPSSPGPAVQVARSSTGAGLSALAGGLGAAAANLDRVVERQNAEAERSSGFETQRRFLEFAAQQEDTLKQGQQSVQPGAFGYSEQARAGYKESATEFMKTVPDHLKGEYDVKLFGVEDRLVSQATTFEQGARRQHYGAAVDDTLTGIEGRLFANPDDYDTILAEGNALIDAIPDEGFSQIEKAELKRGWEDKAKLAVLNGVTPEERIRLLGGVDPNAKTEVPKNIQKGIAGYDPAVSKVIVEESRRAGVNPEAMFVISWLESRGKPGAKNPKSSAGGLFQQIDSNAKAYGVQNRFDARQSAAGAARFMADNARKLRKVLGRDPTIGELYLAHQQGGGGASKLLSNPNARAADLVGADAVRLNGGDVDMTASEFAGIWLKKAGDAHVPDGGLLNADFDPDKADSRFANFDYQSAQGAIQGAQRDILQAEKAQERVAVQSVTDYMAWLGTGRQGEQPPLPPQAMESLPDDVRQEVLHAETVADAVQTVRSLPIPEAERFVESLAPSGEGFAAEADVQQQAGAALSDAVRVQEAAHKEYTAQIVDQTKGATLLEREGLIANYTDDPKVSAALQSQQQKFASNLKSNQVGLMRSIDIAVPDLDTENLTQSLSARLSYVTPFAERNGVQPQLMTPEERTVMLSQFEQSPLTEKLSFMTEIAGNPDVAGAFFSEISDSAPFLSHTGGILVNGGDQSAAMTAMRGYQAKVDKTPVDDLTMTDKITAMDGDIREALRMAPDVLGDVNAFASNYAVGKSLDSGGVVTPDDYADGLEASIGATYRYNSPGFGRTRPLILPPNTSGEQMTEFFNGMSDDGLRTMNGGQMPRDAAGTEVNADYIRRNADYATIGPGVYVVEFDGEPLIGSDGAPFIMRYSQ